jgi:hypothetical protein
MQVVVVVLVECWPGDRRLGATSLSCWNKAREGPCESGVRVGEMAVGGENTRSRERRAGKGKGDS